ncbi:GumC family protein [Algoriphagus antarcticus]|uniref:non-specific protein-tyrosine kinase n=1 Tax=Algoriphagus antarcticus TaxID=238540 RepID=A0A3E0DFD2_9BACT|nr:tyrosine-protein kinase family protein [Algoriphagus antarcticus]REG81411.1 capsular exopolysaccharide synthesis family protein [Algoriphagus antarcticus]
MKLSNIFIEDTPNAPFSGMDVKSKLNKLFKVWPLFLLSFALVLTGVWTYVYYAVPNYAVNSSIMVKDVTKGANFLENPIFEGLNEFKSSNTVDNEMDVIQSGILMRDVVRDLNLYNDYFAINSVKRKSAIFYKDLPFTLEKMEIFTLNPKDSKEKKSMLVKEFHETYIVAEINDELIQIDIDKLVKTKYASFVFSYTNQPSLGVLENPILVNFVSPDELAGKFASNLNAETKDKQSSILYISLLETVPQRGVMVLDKLIEIYNAQMAEDKKEVARKSLDFLNSQISLTLSELNDMEKGIETFKNSKNVVDVQTDTKVYQENYIRNNREISDLENQIDIYNNVESVVSQETDGDISGLSSLIKSDPYLSSMMTDYQDSKAKISEYEKSIMPDNPLMIKQKSLLNSARKNIINHIAINLKQLEITLQNLTNENAQFQNKSNSAPQLERQYEAISRDVEVKKDHYLYLIKKKEETSLFIASVPSNQAKVIESASFSFIPSKPYPPVLYIAGIFFAFTVPFAYVFGGSLLSDKIVVRSDLSSISQIDVLGEISFMKHEEPFVINYKNNTPISEQFRLIRSNFNYKLDTSICKVVLVTSSISGEGKTFFAINFAKSLSMVGKKVALLEYDLRKKGLREDLKFESGRGISNYLTSNDFSLQDLMISGNEVNGITVYQVGKIAENPSEIMYSNKNSDFINKLKEEFDYIVIDTAPIGLVSDALALSEIVDYSIFIVRYDYTTKKNLGFFEDILKSNRLKNPMIVINGSKNSLNYAYGNYSHS